MTQEFDIKGFSFEGKRPYNEDSLFPNDEIKTTIENLFLVCDGVGGQAKGEIASDLVCTQINAYFTKQHLETTQKSDIEAAVKFVESKFDSYIVDNPDASGMGSTLTLLHLHKKGATVAHIGDSRVYQFRKGEILFRTKDHSMVQALFDSGVITEEEMATHSQRNMILQAIQGASIKKAKVDVSLLTDIQEDDIFFLCSDGVLESFDDKELQALFAENDSVDTIAAKMVKKCSERSSDNFSGYLVKIDKAYIDALKIDKSDLLTSTLPPVGHGDGQKEEKTVVYSPAAEAVSEKEPQTKLEAPKVSDNSQKELLKTTEDSQKKVSPPRSDSQKEAEKTDIEEPVKEKSDITKPLKESEKTMAFSPEKSQSSAPPRQYGPEKEKNTLYRKLILLLGFVLLLALALLAYQFVFSDTKSEPSPIPTPTPTAGSVVVNADSVINEQNPEQALTSEKNRAEALVASNIDQAIAIYAELENKYPENKALGKRKEDLEKKKADGKAEELTRVLTSAIAGAEALVASDIDKAINIYAELAKKYPEKKELGVRKEELIKKKADNNAAQEKANFISSEKKRAEALVASDIDKAIDIYAKLAKKYPENRALGKRKQELQKEKMPKADDKVSQDKLAKVAEASRLVKAKEEEENIKCKAKASKRSDAAQKVFESIKWVEISAGSFTMGSPDSEVGRYSSEGPQHEVTLSAFKMSAHCITFEQYDAFCEATNREKPGDKAWGRGNRPVINVSWEDAVTFADWLGGGVRLPTEAEWEYACRAGTTTPFNTGANLTTEQANYHGDYPYNNNAKGDYRGKTVPVGSFAPNAWGLYDMHGNVWEWCNDWYDKDYYSKDAAKDPKGPSSGSYRVARGGSWGNDARGCRSADRSSGSPANRGNIIGFRLVCPQ